LHLCPCACREYQDGDIADVSQMIESYKRRPDKAAYHLRFEVLPALELSRTSGVSHTVHQRWCVCCRLSNLIKRAPRSTRASGPSSPCTSRLRSTTILRCPICLLDWATTGLSLSKVVNGCCSRCSRRVVFLSVCLFDSIYDQMICRLLLTSSSTSRPCRTCLSAVIST